MVIAFYVLTISGVLLYSQQLIFEAHSPVQSSPLLVAGFFSAIEIFAKEYANHSIDIIQIGNYILRFSLSENFNCIFCLGHNKNPEEAKYKYLLNVLKSLFIFEFEPHLKKNSGNLSPYKKFDRLFELILPSFGIKITALKVQIEHFTCGYLGEFRDFQNKSGLRCPNCKDILTQQGIDYQIKTS